MRRGIFWIFLFVLGASLLGATVFREQVAQAVGSTSGSAPVTETNLDANGFIRVHDQGTVNVALTSTGSTVKIDPAGNTVSLSSTDRAKLDEYVSHRLERERRLVEALDQGARSVDALLDQVWDDAPRQLRGPATWTLAAHLDKLEQEGRLLAGVERPQITLPGEAEPGP